VRFTQTIRAGLLAMEAPMRRAATAMQMFAVAASNVPTHGYCTKCAVWLRLDVARGRCTVCFGKLTPM
jgi:hypothetical protein